MKATNLFYVLVACAVGFISAPLHAATINISGTLGGEQDLFGNNSAANYPFPSLFGGSFSGTFDYDPDSGPVNSNSTFREYAMTSVSIDIIDNIGTVFNTITNQSPENNTIVAARDGSFIKLVFGYSAGIYQDTEDLRIVFNGSFSTTSGPTVAELNASTFDTTPNRSFLETDSAFFSSWDLEVTSASMSGIVVAPVPAAVWLFGSGLLGLVAFARRNAK